MHTRELRKRAAQACIDRFNQRPYKPGIRDCPRLVLYNLHRLHVPVPFAAKLKWKSESDGLRVLKGLGFANLIDAVDALGLPRIAPAMARLGDIIALPTDHKVGALSVAVGNGRVLGFTDHSPNGEIIEQLEFLTDALGPCAWRVIDG